MSLTDDVLATRQRGIAARPRVGGFPVLAESLRLGGVVSVAVTVPSLTTVYTTPSGSVIDQGPPMFVDVAEVPSFDRQRFIDGLRADQAGEISFPEWLRITWESGVVWYEVDLIERRCTYRSAAGESFVEDYPAVVLDERSTNGGE